MLHSWITDSNFRVGMKNYLNKYAYANAQTDALWEELGAASGMPVKSVMSGWTSKMGFPVITAKVKNWDDTGLTISLSPEWPN